MASGEHPLNFWKKVLQPADTSMHMCRDGSAENAKLIKKMLMAERHEHFFTLVTPCYDRKSKEGERT
jgi:hypothetical protein